MTFTFRQSFSYLYLLRFLNNCIIYSFSFFQVGKSSVLTLTNKEKAAKAEQSQRRQDRIRQHEDLIRKETEERERQRRTMEEKTRLYDRMTNGEELVYGDGSKAEFLVNFDVKQRRQNEDSGSEDERDKGKGRCFEGLKLFWGFLNKVTVVV